MFRPVSETSESGLNIERVPRPDRGREQTGRRRNKTPPAAVQNKYSTSVFWCKLIYSKEDVV